MYSKYRTAQDNRSRGFMTQVDTMLADKELSADMVPVLLMREQLKESHHIKLILVWVLIVVPSILGILTIILSQHLG